MTVEPGTLYITATPIGNLGDLTPRAREALLGADLIAAEDTRRTLNLLRSLDGENTIVSFHEHSPAQRAEELVARLKEGKSICLVTDAGTPVISDPGAVLVRRAAEEGLPMTSLPGACAAVTALTLAALPADHFYFEGFLPRDKTREARLKWVVTCPETVILYESPHQLTKTLKDLADKAPGRRMALLRELTKLHEEVLRGTTEELCSLMQEREPRGEYVLVLEGAPVEEEEVTDDRILKELEEALTRLRGKDAVRETAEKLGVPKNRVYKLYVEGKE